MAFTVIDIETTGLSKHQSKITEIAAARVENGKIIEQFQSLVNPETDIPRFITRLTGIHNEMVKDSPTIKEILPYFIQFLGEDVFVAHNASFDFGFLEHNCSKHHNHSLDNNRLCTRKLANRILPELPRKRLQDLCEHYDVTNKEAHRAMGDVEATVEVFSHLLNHLEGEGISNINDILDFEKAPRRR
jgi:DNA polymerase III subunit alpha, Gram-positive type